MGKRKTLEDVKTLLLKTHGETVVIKDGMAYAGQKSELLKIAEYLRKRHLKPFLERKYLTKTANAEMMDKETSLGKVLRSAGDLEDLEEDLEEESEEDLLKRQEANRLAKQILFLERKLENPQSANIDQVRTMYIRSRYKLLNDFFDGDESACNAFLAHHREATKRDIEFRTTRLINYDELQKLNSRRQTVAKRAAKIAARSMRK